MTIDHVGYAVKDIGKAQEAMSVLGYIFGSVIRDLDRNIQIAFGEMDRYRVELVAPMGDGSPVDGFLGKGGAMPYHICYRSTDMDSDVARLKAAGYRVVVPMAPAVAFGGKKVVFLYSLQAGLVEIVER